MELPFFAHGNSTACRCTGGTHGAMLASWSDIGGTSSSLTVNVTGVPRLAEACQGDGSDTPPHAEEPSDGYSIFSHTSLAVANLEGSLIDGALSVTRISLSPSTVQVRPCRVPVHA